MPPSDIKPEIKPKSYTRNLFIQVAKYTVIAFLIITPIRFFVAQPFIVSGGSMEPTFNSKEYLVIDEWSHRKTAPERGDVIVFRYPLDPSVYFVKRVIGLPGETVVIQDGVVSIQSPGGHESRIISEPYLSNEYSKKDSSTTKLGWDEYFVLGDNRSGSADSRTWGPLQKRFIVGQPLVRLFPLQKIEFFPGAHHFSDAQ